MPEIFPIKPSQDARVRLSFPHELRQTVQGYDHINVKNIQPILNFDLSKNWMSETDKEAILSLFETVQGSQDFFLFKDFSDYKATFNEFDLSKPVYSAIADYDRGFTVGVLATDIDGNVRLTKKYTLLNSGNEVYRVITYPDISTLAFYDVNDNPISGLSVQEGTGIVTGSIPSGIVTWSGEFYVPVRFVDDNFSFRKTSSNLYAFDSLQLQEVKIFTSRIPQQKISTFIDDYFSLIFSFDSEAKNEFNTIIDTYDNQYETREQQFDLLQQRYILTQKNLLDESDKEYLLLIFRVCLGSFSTLKYYQFEDSNTMKVSIESDLVLRLSRANTSIPLYKTNNLVLKTSDFNDTFLNTLRTTYCKAWEIETTLGDVYRVIEGDQSVTINGQVFSPLYSQKGYAISTNIDFEVDNTELEGDFNLSFINEADVIAGKFQDATIKIMLVDWNAQTIFATIFNGFLGEYEVSYTKNGAKKYKFQALSFIRDLTKNVSVTTSSYCRHKFLEQGYGKCDKSFTIDDFPSNSPNNVRVRTTISEVVRPDRIKADSGSGDWDEYNYGTVLFESGVLEGQEFLMGGNSGDTINLTFTLPLTPSVGDQILVTKHCTHSLEACQFYQNEENFGGFPDLAGFDNIIRPSAD